MFGLGPSELVIVGVVAILLFGSKLPDVMRSLGKSYREFRSGLSEFHSHVNLSDTLTSAPVKSYASKAAPRDPDDYEEATAPKFEPPPSEPIAEVKPSGDIAKPIAEK